MLTQSLPNPLRVLDDGHGTALVLDFNFDSVGDGSC